MYFTLLFRDGLEGPTLPYDLVYHPNPIWCKNGELLVKNPGPYYEIGYLDNLFKHETHLSRLDNIPRINRKVEIICHYEGHGTVDCLGKIIEDLQNQHFRPSIICTSGGEVGGPDPLEIIADINEEEQRRRE